ncbi:DUF2264 domain-containing protein [Phyllobacterium sp. YR531]|uniref:DUF2264 domain-containing protein n=1 Tax=Phyllobacterium sp. YR531 TaxID=1144343 RepID=UPI00026F98EB|nr:DUF2264 domain-containing protein [Phyllobacterium sp. YR531]EJN02214.1 hypothetical protein PMI41_02965 [Phyllobacterium sp. YR531]
MPDIVFPPNSFRILEGNPFQSRNDVEQAVAALAAPLEKFRSMGGARIRRGVGAAHFDQPSADLEGFSRLLWGLVPAQIGGADWIDWEPICRGLASGTNPLHSEFWGAVPDKNQRLVELAAIGFALKLVPHKIWEPLSNESKHNVARYLVAAHGVEYHNNNWKFFRLLLGMGLRAVGIEYNQKLDEQYEADLDTFYVGDGWYSDGPIRRVDYYIPFAFHYYGLILAALQPNKLAEQYKQRAHLIASDICRWFADDGAGLVFGRSLTYRCAPAGFFGALAFANVEALPWGVLKGFYLRHLRWWASKPVSNSDGTLSIGYTYPNLLMSESYNSPQSPYWAMKAFLPLALPSTHPFWSEDEVPYAKEAKPAIQLHPGFIISNPPGDAIALSSGQQCLQMRHGSEKYAKFAYSARYGFSIESDQVRFDEAVLDGMIGFSDDGKHFRTRETNEKAMIADGTLYSRWRPYTDVTVHTWLYWDGPFHIRVHRIDTPRPLKTIEGGFAVGRDYTNKEKITAEGLHASIETATDLSAVIDLGSTVIRNARVHHAPPNTNLVATKTTLPQLVGDIPAGESILVAAFIAQTNPQTVKEALKSLPAKPNVSALQRLIVEQGVSVTIMGNSALL